MQFRCNRPLRLSDRAGSITMNPMESILVVDDDRNIREVVRYALTDAGYPATAA